MFETKRFQLLMCFLVVRKLVPYIFIVRPQTKPRCRKKLERGGPWGAAEPKADGTENKSNS